MKTPTKLTVLTVLALAFASTAVYGANQNRGVAQNEPCKSCKKTTNKPAVERVQVTGSRIPRAVKVSNYPSGTELTLTMIDRKQLDHLGAGNLNEAMKKVPMAR